MQFFSGSGQYVSQPRRIKQQAAVIKKMSLPPLPRKAPGVWAVSVVRDELDVLPSVLDHLFAQGVDHVLIADNRSQDGTREYLRKRSLQDPRLHVALDEEVAHTQFAKVTYLAHKASLAGAEWIIPFDGDEFWFAPEGTLKEWLTERSENKIYAAFHHMVPLQPVKGSEIVEATFMMDTAASVPSKVAFRSHPFAWVYPGNHEVKRVGTWTNGLHIAHAQYRSPVQVARKVRQGTASSALTGEDLDWFSPHWAKASRLSDEEIHDVWRNISSGKPDTRIEYKATGPMVEVRPLKWRTWDEDGTIAAATADAEK
ncbi:glycosyltransferase family 2 protein [Dermabacteraceae bacterium CCM 9519]